MRVHKNAISPQRFPKGIKLSPELANFSIQSIDLWNYKISFKVGKYTHV